MKYFLHSTDSFDDEKVSLLFQEYGYEGVGLFYVALEKMAKQEKPVNTSVLKYQLKVGKRLEKCWKFMESLGILSSSNGDTFNERLLNYAESYKIKKEKTAKKISEWREKQRNAENVTSYENICNSPKVKLSKVNKSKVIYNTPVDGEKTPSVYPEFISRYDQFVKQVNGTPAKIDAVQGSFAKKIITYLLKTVKEKNDSAGGAEVLAAWEIVLSSYSKWDDWQRGRIRLQDIYTNLENIINSIRNGKSTGKARRQPATSPEDIDRIGAAIFRGQPIH